MLDNDAVELAQLEVTRAREALEELERAQRLEINEVRQRHANAIAEARTRLSRAEWSVKEAKSETLPDHEWEGKRVVKRKFVGGYSSNRTDDVFGVVHTCRIDTEFPANLSTWSKPKIGQSFVRLLKKDGTEGSRIDYPMRDWRLASDTEAKP